MRLINSVFARLVLIVATWLCCLSLTNVAGAATVNIISNGTFAAGTTNAWTNWAFSATGARTTFTSFTNVGPNSQEDNTGTLDLVQSGMAGLNVGPGTLGAGQLLIQTGWNTCGTNGASLNIYIGATLYATFTTPVSVGTGSTAGMTTYSNGAAGTVGSAIPSSTYTGWTYYPWTINLPTSVTANGNLHLSFLQTGAGGCFADISVQSVTLNIYTPTLKLTKISNGGTGSFTFSGTNGWSNQTIATATVGTGVVGTTQVLTNTSTATTLTESQNPTFSMSAVSCTGMGSGGTVTPNLQVGTISFNAAATAVGASIACTITNALGTPAMTIAKTYSPAGPYSVGQTVTYSYVITNTGNTTMTNVQVKDMHGSPATLVALGAGGITGESLTTAGPLGSGASPDTTSNDGIWSTLAPGAAVTFTWAHKVTQAEIDHG